MRYILLAIFLATGLLPFSELKAQKAVLVGTVYDKDLMNPIRDVAINQKSDRNKVMTDRKGGFTIDLEGGKSFIEFSHISYRDTSLRVRYAEGDTLRLSIYLEFEVFEIPTIDVTSERKPDTVYGSRELNVADYMFGEHGIILLNYKKEERWKKQSQRNLTLYNSPELVMIDSSGHEKCVLRLEAEPLHFYTDYLDDGFLVCEDAYFGILTDTAQIFLDKIDRETFELHIIPGIDTLKRSLYFSTYSPDYPSFAYYSVDTLDTLFTHLRTIEDKLQMELLRSEFKYLSTRDKLEAFRAELRTGIDKEIIAAQMSGFANSMYAESLYAPCFIVNDTVVIFDHYHNKMIKFDTENQAVDSIEISYHKKTKGEKWKKKLVCDSGEDKIYSLYQRHGYSYLKEIDLNSGEAINSIRLTYRYPEKIRIKDGWAYYIYRPFESPQKRFLYKEELF